MIITEYAWKHSLSKLMKDTLKGHLLRKNEIIGRRVRQVAGELTDCGDYVGATLLFCEMRGE